MEPTVPNFGLHKEGAVRAHIALVLNGQIGALYTRFWVLRSPDDGWLYPSTSVPTTRDKRVVAEVWRTFDGQWWWQKPGEESQKVGPGDRDAPAGIPYTADALAWFDELTETRCSVPAATHHVGCPCNTARLIRALETALRTALSERKSGAPGVTEQAAEAVKM